MGSDIEIQNEYRYFAGMNSSDKNTFDWSTIHVISNIHDFEINKGVWECLIMRLSRDVTNKYN